MKGYKCIAKDTELSVCKQMEVGPWDDAGKPSKELEPPKGWDGDVVGGYWDEYPLPRAREGEPQTTTTLFCFHAVLPGSAEEALVDAARSRKAGIFGCEEHAIFESSKAKFHKWDSGYSTLVNTEGFVKVWDQVRGGGLYKKADFTLKVDADCVFFPARVRSHLVALQAPADRAFYVKNTRPHFLAGGFLGAVEVLSREATSRLVRNIRTCEKYMGTLSGEDGFLKDCLDALGAAFMQDKTLLHPDDNAISCQIQEFAAYHPMKNPGAWAYCYDIAAGNIKPPPLVQAIVELLPAELHGKYTELVAEAARAAAQAAAADPAPPSKTAIVELKK